MTSIPIPSAGIRPILSDCRAAVVMLRKDALKAISMGITFDEQKIIKRQFM